jgi:type I restriction enzyme S subunit
VKFGDVVRHVKETADPESSGLERYVAGEHMDTDQLQITRWGAIGDGYLGPAFHRRFRSGQVLYGSRRTYLRKVALADFDGICANTTFVCETRDPDVLLPELLPFVMQADSFHAHSIAQSKGSVNPYINWPDLAPYEFDLPPINEQREIAELLLGVELTHLQWRRCRRRLHDAHAAAARSYLNLGLAGEPQETDDVPLKRIGDLYTVRSGATPNRSKHTQYFEGGDIPWVKTLDLNEALITSTDEMITDLALRDTACRVFPENTILVAMYGGFNQIGRTGLLGTKAATNQAISALTEPKTPLEPRFIHAVLRAVRPRWRRVAASSRKDPNITKSDIENLLVPVPSLERQRELAEQLHSFDRALDRASHQLDKLRRLRASLAMHLFGESA